MDMPRHPYPKQEKDLGRIKLPNGQVYCVKELLSNANKQKQIINVRSLHSKRQRYTYEVRQWIVDSSVDEVMKRFNVRKQTAVNLIQSSKLFLNNDRTD